MPTPGPRVLSGPHRSAAVAGVMLALLACHPPNPAAVPPDRSDLLPAADFIHLQWEDCVAPARSTSYTDPAGNAPVALVDSVVLDITGMDSAWVWRAASDTADRWDVVVRLSRSGAADFGATTATHVGRRLAVVVDRRVTLMPRVDSPLQTRVIIASGVARQVADSLAHRVNRAVAMLRPIQPARIVHQSPSRRTEPRC